MSKPIECWAVVSKSYGVELCNDKSDVEAVKRDLPPRERESATVHHLVEDRGERDALRRVLEAVQAYDDARVELVCPSAIEQWRLRRCEAIAAGWKALGET